MPSSQVRAIFCCPCIAGLGALPPGDSLTLKQACTARITMTIFWRALGPSGLFLLYYILTCKGAGHLQSNALLD